MRLSRAKAIRKHLRFYRIVYGIVPPYQVRQPCPVSHSLDRTHDPHTRRYQQPPVNQRL